MGKMRVQIDMLFSQSRQSPIEQPPQACACPQYLRWVCGRDGRTYENECAAGCQGKTSVACFGRCPCDIGEVADYSL